MYTPTAAPPSLSNTAYPVAKMQIAEFRSEFYYKLTALTRIMFLYSEDMCFSKSVESEIRESKALFEAGKTGQDIVSFTPFFDPLKMLRESHSLDIR